MTSEAGEIMEKLKEKKAEYETVASTDSSVNLENIDNRIITDVLGLESQAQAKVQRLRDQIVHMQVSTVEQIAEVHRKYKKLQQQLRAVAPEREVATAAKEVAATVKEVATAAKEVAATVKEVEAVAMVAEQSRKNDELQL
ncbi:Calcium-binding and coiled-coil domain-containing 1 [Gossypium arboreum]|uniref:Calcium-binding and coiled-coil domain-containing 1 n=1 Tax=Gossypium arboreum TaxID=29729 RepID=A0A0B0PE53_GOSAR|nr:Calcium-binding and coiled-coil domain-containing 1 [Gossypium arboreum]